MFLLPRRPRPPSTSPLSRDTCFYHIRSRPFFLPLLYLVEIRIIAASTSIHVVTVAKWVINIVAKWVINTSSCRHPRSLSPLSFYRMYVLHIFPGISTKALGPTELLFKSFRTWGVDWNLAFTFPQPHRFTH